MALRQRAPYRHLHRAVDQERAPGAGVRAERSQDLDHRDRNGREFSYQPVASGCAPGCQAGIRFLRALRPRDHDDGAGHCRRETDRGDRSRPGSPGRIHHPAALPKDAGRYLRSTMKLRLSENFRAIFYAPFYATQALGFFAREGLEVELGASSAPGDAVPRLLDGSIDVTWGGP